MPYCSEKIWTILSKVNNVYSMFWVNEGDNNLRASISSTREPMQLEKKDGDNIFEPFCTVPHGVPVDANVIS